jgi:hypothetical protein
MLIISFRILLVQVTRNFVSYEFSDSFKLWQNRTKLQRSKEQKLYFVFLKHSNLAPK